MANETNAELWSKTRKPNAVGPNYETLLGSAYPKSFPQEPVEEDAAENAHLQALIDSEEVPNTIDFAADW